jgi:hypothetical protein
VATPLTTAAGTLSACRPLKVPDQPWRALIRGFFLLMTMVRPRRRTIWPPGMAFRALSELRTFMMYSLLLVMR